MAETPTVGVVMLAYGDEPYLDSAVAAVLGSRDVLVDLVLVDNGCSRADLAEIAAAGATLVRPRENLGFTGGVSLGAAHVRGEYLALVNSDAIVAADALARLVRTASASTVGIATGSIRLASDDRLMNSAGNPVHFLGLCWAGGLGDPAEGYALARDVPSASGAGLVLRRAVWEALGGFPDAFFAYQEDLELSWRCWQRGLAVRFVPDAVVVHHYEFSRNALKMYLLERNRLLFVLTCYGGRTLVLLAPVLLAFEAAMLLVAASQGWARHKVRGWVWVLRHLGWVVRRRRAVQRERSVPDRQMSHLWSATFDASAVRLPPGSGVVQRALAAYWSVVRRAL